MVGGGLVLCPSLTSVTDGRSSALPQKVNADSPFSSQQNVSANTTLLLICFRPSDLVAKCAAVA